MLAIVQGGVVVLAIGILIFVHELGHFLVAKKVGIRVDAFSLGFGPTIWGFTRGETTYKLSLIPLGGYVKMAGEFKEEGDVNTGEEFFSKTVTQRAWVVSAGVIMNIIFAIIAFPLAFSIGVPFDAPVVGFVAPGGAAWRAGVLPGDRIAKIDESDVISFADIRTSCAFNDVAQNFHIVRDGKEIELTVKPDYDEDRGLHVVGLGGTTLYTFGDDAKKLPKGIKPGMELLAIDGIPVSSGLDFEADFYREGEVITLSVREGKNGSPIDVKIPAHFEKANGDAKSIGVIIQRTQVKHIRKALPGEEESIAQKLGIKGGDIITQINGSILGESGSFGRIAFSLAGQKTLRIHVKRDGKDVLLETNSWNGNPLSLINSLQLTYADEISLRITKDSAAEKAGLKDGDVLLAYAGKKLGEGIEGWKKFQEAVKEADGERETIVVRRGDEELTFGVKSAPTMVNVLGQIINARPLQERVQLAFPESVTVGFDQAVSQFKSIILTLKSLFSGKVAAKNLGGIITIAVVSYTFVEQGLGKILFFMAILSLNLAVLNILPIPVLDGGHLMFLALEKIKGGPLSERLMGYANVVGLVFILGLMVFVTFNDIQRFFFPG